MPNARQRGTGVRIRSEAKAAAADRLLLAAQEASESFKAVLVDLNATPAWRFRRRRSLKKLAYLWLERHHAAITSAQDIAKKGRYVDLGGGA